MPFSGDTFTHLFDWEKDPQRQEKIINARLEAEFDGVDIGLSAVAADVSTLQSLVDSSAWAAFTPTVTPNAGSITTLGAVAGRYKLIGKTVFVQLDIAITTNGTGSGFIIAADLPFTSSAFKFIIVGQELNVTGDQLVGHIPASSTVCNIIYYSGAYPGGDGVRLVLTGVAEIA